ncbi:hypothetical protein MSKU15_0101 [Komagataeibacter diospyri]|nr:hypothetical protein MSKU15_0101 [Komagataeibacter diospyri]
MTTFRPITISVASCPASGPIPKLCQEKPVNNRHGVGYDITQAIPERGLSGRLRAEFAAFSQNSRAQVP